MDCPYCEGRGYNVRGDGQHRCKVCFGTGTHRATACASSCPCKKNTGKRAL